MRSRFFRSLLAQDTEFFELLDLENLSEQATKKFEELSNCIGEKIGLLASAIGAILGGLVLALIVSSLFTIVLLFVFFDFLMFYMCFSACC
jgi:tetrahydromethanopterin S-methyltransferase subunit G